MLRRCSQRPAALPQVPPLRGHRPSGSLVAGYLAPLGWLGHVLCAVGGLSLASRSQARCFASLTPGGSLSAGSLRFAPARRAPPRLRLVGAGASDGVGAGVDQSVDGNGGGGIGALGESAAHSVQWR